MLSFSDNRSASSCRSNAARRMRFSSAASGPLSRNSGMGSANVQDARGMSSLGRRLMDFPDGRPAIRLPQVPQQPIVVRPILLPMPVPLFGQHVVQLRQEREQRLLELAGLLGPVERGLRPTELVQVQVEPEPVEEMLPAH